MKVFRLRVHGKVQGVFYRHSTKGVADLLKIKGWIRNEPDGTVLMEVKGDKEALEQFLDWCREGPDRAKVEKVEVLEIEVMDGNSLEKNQTSFINFDILK